MQSLLPDALLRAVEQGILGLLLALGAACILIFVWRWRAAIAAHRGALPWLSLLEKELTGQTHGEDLAVNPRPGESGMGARLVRLGLDNASLCPEALEKLLEVQQKRERLLLERGAQFLGTVGANAPFLGLTGTVLGILAAFRNMSEQGGGGPEVMAAIAGALIATAAGLVVAIPAVVLYNMLKARIRKTLEGMEEIKNLLLARSFQAAVKESF
jgi:biopolymer transport protein ExbB